MFRKMNESLLNLLVKEADKKIKKVANKNYQLRNDSLEILSGIVKQHYSFVEPPNLATKRLFEKLIKRHALINGNKRMAIAILRNIQVGSDVTMPRAVLTKEEEIEFVFNKVKNLKYTSRIHFMEEKRFIKVLERLQYE